MPAVLVRVSGPDPKSLKTQHRSFFSSEAGRTSLSCSGFALPDSLVVTSGWLLAPFVKEGSRDELIAMASIDLCRDDGKWVPAKLLRIVDADAAALQAAQGISTNPRLPTIRGVNLCSVAVLRCELEPGACCSAVTTLAPEHRGEALTVVSSAYGLVSPAVFRNCVTKGVLSNVVGERDALLLTDARCLAGSEGAPVLTSGGELVGMVLPSIPRQDATHVELGAVLPAHCFWAQAQLPPPAMWLRAGPRVAAGGLDCVALVQVGQSWGSGVLVGGDLVVTCAHVVRPAMSEAEGGRLVPRPGALVMVSFKASKSDPFQIPSRILFCSSGPVDIALLQLTSVPADVRAAEWAPRGEEEQACGEAVLAVGHAIFEPSGPGGRSATCSQGQLARVVRLDGRPVMFQSSALVFRGHSGGMLADAKGRLLGVISCNAKHSDGSIIPEINFAIPWSLVQDLGLGPDEDVFARLDAPDARLKTLWALEPVGLDKPPVAAADRPSSFGSFLDRFMQSKL